MIILLSLLSTCDVEAQSVNRQPIPSVYLDCQRCDFNYIRTNIAFVNYVRDQDDANIYLRITDSRTSGGHEYTLDFRGMEPFSSRRDTLTYRTRDTDSSDEERAGLVRYIKIGLVPFAGQTSALENLNVFYNAPAETEEEEDTTDPWRGWVFDINLRTWLNGEETEQNFGLHTGLFAERITDRFKTRTRVRGDLSRRTLELTDETVHVNRDWGEYWGLYAYSLNQHASIGLFSQVNFHRPNNIRMNIEASPAFEYNFFPYQEYQERRFIVRYRVTPGYRSYYEETIFFQNSEYLLHQNLNTQLRYDQPWGRVDISVNASNYFHDREINRVEFWPSLNVRIIRGLSASISGRYRIINDQVSLPVGEISDQDRLTGQVQQPTSFDYSISVGLSYTFGSIYNSVVNPRF
ncbi:MAG: hypothetical protein WD317_08735 [Balneolaceae bacterium]